MKWKFKYDLRKYGIHRSEVYTTSVKFYYDNGAESLSYDIKTGYYINNTV